MEQECDCGRPDCSFCGGEFRILQKAVHENAKAHGFWEGSDENKSIPVKLALIHSEVSEALEDYREGNMTLRRDATSGKPCGFPTELADIVIRAMDLAQHEGIDLWGRILEKHNFNRSRPYKHGNKSI